MYISTLFMAHCFCQYVSFDSPRVPLLFLGAHSSNLIQSLSLSRKDSFQRKLVTYTARHPMRKECSNLVLSLSLSLSLGGDTDVNKNSFLLFPPFSSDCHQMLSQLVLFLLVTSLGMAQR